MVTAVHPTPPVNPPGCRKLPVYTEGYTGILLARTATDSEGRSADAGRGGPGAADSAAVAVGEELRHQHGRRDLDGHPAGRRGRGPDRILQPGAVAGDQGRQ